MKFTTGIELSKAFYEQHGKPMLMEQFGDKINRMAIGLVGHGSECFGFDDEVSLDHDYEPGFCIWLTDEDERDFGFKLFRAYSKLPKEFMGVKIAKESLLGSKHKGVHTINEFYSYYLGAKVELQTNSQWLSIPSFYLAEATNGEVFFDGVGEFTRIREMILNDMPQDVWNKKLASALFLMAQAGQYNYARCIAHGEKGAAVMAFNNFAKNYIEAVFILNRRHCPYYKWSIRAMRSLKLFSDRAQQLENALGEPLSAQTALFIENSANEIIAHLKTKGYQDKGDYLEPYAYMVNDSITDGNLRNMPIVL